MQSNALINKLPVWHVNADLIQFKTTSNITTTCVNKKMNASNTLENCVVQIKMVLAIETNWIIRQIEMVKPINNKVHCYNPSIESVYSLGFQTDEQKDASGMHFGVSGPSV